MKYKYLMQDQYDNEVDERLHDAASWWLVNHDWDGEYLKDGCTRADYASGTLKKWKWYARHDAFLYITLWMPDEHHLHIISEQVKCVITPYQVEREFKRCGHDADKLLLRWVREG